MLVVRIEHASPFRSHAFRFRFSLRRWAARSLKLGGPCRPLPIALPSTETMADPNWVWPWPQRFAGPKLRDRRRLLNLRTRLRLWNLGQCCWSAFPGNLAKLTHLRIREASNPQGPSEEKRPRRYRTRRGLLVVPSSRLCSRAAVIRRLSTDSSQQIRLRDAGPKLRTRRPLSGSSNFRPIPCH